MNDQDVTFDSGGCVLAGHLLRPDPDCVGPRGYKRAVRTPVSPDVLGLVTNWVTRHWGTS